MRVPRTEGCFFSIVSKLQTVFLFRFFSLSRNVIFCVQSTHTVPRIDVLEFLTLRGARWGCARGVVGKQVAGARDFWVFFES